MTTTASMGRAVFRFEGVGRRLLARVGVGVGARPRRLHLSPLYLAEQQQEEEHQAQHQQQRQLTVLFVSSVWPEVRSSAAGVRTMGLIRALLLHGHRVVFACTAKAGEALTELRDLGVHALRIDPNDTRVWKGTLLGEEASRRPDVCVFDRFSTEEMFSHHVHRHCPSALRVLDTQDLHCVRTARMDAVRAGASIAEALNIRPDATCGLVGRELAAIHRSDLTLVCSPAEYELLQTSGFAVPRSKLAMATFFYPGQRQSQSHLAPPGLSGRSGTHMMIGNWRHPPNRDSAQWLIRDIWPLVRASIPNARLHVYGAYPAREDMGMHCPRAGVHLKGPAKDVSVMQKYRLLLAPLRFGAGASAC